jgi:hypothetical protein
MTIQHGVESSQNDLRTIPTRRTEGGGATNRTQSFFDSLVAAMRENPVAAALIGGGAFWLLTGEKLKRAAPAAASAGFNIAVGNLRSPSAVQRTTWPPAAPEKDQSSHVGQTLHDAGSAASDAVFDAADKIKDRFDEGVAYAREGVVQPEKEALANVKSSVTAIFEQQPLVLGVVGVAVGTAIASAFPPTDFENKWAGELSDDVRTDLSTRAGAVSQSLREASNKLTS